MADLRLATIANLDGLVGLVTGGGTGIGLIIARGLAANGAKVYITGRRVDVLEEAAMEKVVGAQWELIPVQLDVTKKESIMAAVTLIEEKEGKLDILVNNAGIAGPCSPFFSNPCIPESSSFGSALFECQDFEHWEEVLRVNSAAPFFMTQAFLALLTRGAQARGETSSVINISSSITDVNLSMNVFAYGASKAALEHTTRSLAMEYALHRIPVRVNAVGPGMFPSQLTGPPDIVACNARVPIPGALLPVPLRRPGRTEEMVATCVYLASRAGGFTNGNIVIVDGGFSLVNP